MFVNRIRAVTLIGMVALTPAPSLACLICTPSPSPSTAPIVRGGQPTPLPPATLRFTENDGWRLGFGQASVPDSPCGQSGVFLGEVYSGQNTNFAYYFRRSDGSVSRTWDVPAAPNIPHAVFGAKKVEDDDGPARSGITDTLVVNENGKSLQSITIPRSCRS
jgi:hypothetical protein